MHPHIILKLSSRICQDRERNRKYGWKTYLTYSPELNPIEQLWGYLKKKLTNKSFKDTSELKKAVLEELEKIKKNKKLIISFLST